MTFTQEQKDDLSAKLDKSKVKTRKQGGRDVAYIEGWHAIAEANRIFGYDGWLRETVEMKPVTSGYKNQNGNHVANYYCKVRITVGDIVREGCGFGSGIDRDEGQAHESAIKEAETDAMKRALMTFGNPFGLALYDKDQRNVGDPNQVDYIVHADNEDQFYEGFELRLSQMPTVSDVNELCKVHGQAINRMKKENPDRASVLKGLVDKRRNELAQKP